MRKETNADPIKSLRNAEKLIVQKSLPLFALWRSDLTLSEFKILDTYLSRIDSHNPDRRVVMFEKGELENIIAAHPKIPEKQIIRIRGLSHETAMEFFKKCNNIK